MISSRDLPLLPVFVAVADAGSFTGAARRLGLAKSVVSQHIRTLEERCGVRLMERSTRSLRLTQIGEQVLDAAREVLASVRSLEHIVQGQHSLPTGTLRVTLPLDPSLSALIAPIAAALVRRYATLRVDVRFDDAIQDLVTSGFDVALRLGSVTESSYVVRRLGSEPEVIVASPAVVSEHGDAPTPKALNGAPWIVHSGLPARSVWTFRSSRADKVQVSVVPKVTTNTVIALRDLLLAGTGVGVLPWHLVRDDLSAGRLCHVCPGWTLRKLTLHALLPTRYGPPRVRVFLECLISAAKALGFEP